MFRNWHTPLCFCCVGFWGACGADVDARAPECSSAAFCITFSPAEADHFSHKPKVSCLIACWKSDKLVSAYNVWNMTNIALLLSSTLKALLTDFTVIAVLSKASWGHHTALQYVHPGMQQHLPISQLSSFVKGFRRLVISMQNHQDQTASALIPGVEPGECDPYRQTLKYCKAGSHYICTETFLTCIFPPHQWCNKGRHIFAL